MVPPRLCPRLPALHVARFRGLRAARVRAALTLAALAAVVLVAPRPAAAYVRARSDGYAPLYWRDPRQVLELARPPAQTNITPAQFQSAAQAALGAWSEGAISCTSVNLTAAPEMSDDQVAAMDGRNRIAMRVGAWCRDPEAMTDCHNADAIATTTRFSRDKPGEPDDGRIIEADIEVNAVDFAWTIIPEGETPGHFVGVFDLQSALTHEAGHFIGLDHSCTLERTSLIDDAGRPVPACGAIPDDQLSEVLDSTMYPSTLDGVVGWRSLTDDDRRGPCEMYPRAAVPVDEWVGMGGCATAGTPPARGDMSPGELMLVLAALAGSALQGRGRAPSTRAGRRPNAR